jgi:peptidoglycan/xylan/chitin deacetylase (PgdA/CDA1 family)
MANYMNRATVLMYHNIGIPPKEARLRGLYVKPRMFRFQMRYLKTAGFKVVTLKEIVDFIKGNDSKEKLVALTFDDGYQDFYENAYPVLKKYGYPSTVFLVSDMVGKKNLWDYEKLNIKKKLMDWDQIMELKEKNVIFGAHSKTHPYLTKISSEECEAEILGSKNVLEKKFGSPVDYFCYPYGDYNEGIARLVKSSNYHGAVTVQRGFVQKGDNPFEIRRVSVKLNTHPLSFLYKLHSNYENR